MSDATSAWQRAEIAGDFLDSRQAALPLIDVQEELVRELLRRHGRPIRRFLDIGAGDGAMSALVRTVDAEAEAVLVDFSAPMLERAQRRLGGSGWQAVRGDLSSPDWTGALDAGPYDAALSAFAIHHLTSERKRALYSELHELLAPGGILVNMDCVTIRGPLAGLFDERIVAVHAELDGHQHDEPFADASEDRPDPAEDQLAWLREVGFEDVELHFKWAEGAIFGGVKGS